ncbi:hypothetical protein MG293_017312 [Ovis ammon polii]|uniref:Uncharacterized protein n=1 Tax=Ovis ammon polii TaxID=230172 RepID=A0AAD4TV43_OVIAM|nr:hypothetical protein MG293_017312 [Ovis ammon polii]
MPIPHSESINKVTLITEGTGDTHSIDQSAAEDKRVLCAPAAPHWDCTTHQELQLSTSYQLECLPVHIPHTHMLMSCISLDIPAFFGFGKRCILPIFLRPDQKPEGNKYRLNELACETRDEKHRSTLFLLSICTDEQNGSDENSEKAVKLREKHSENDSCAQAWKKMLIHPGLDEKKTERN